jgi:hypothetical protein
VTLVHGLWLNLFILENPEKRRTESVKQQRGILNMKHSPIYR